MDEQRDFNGCSGGMQPQFNML